MLADAHWPSVAYGVRVTNLNPADTIGASAWLVETAGHRILLDAGSSPGVEGRAGLPCTRRWRIRTSMPSPFLIATRTTADPCRWRSGTFHEREC